MSMKSVLFSRESGVACEKIVLFSRFWWILALTLSAMFCLHGIHITFLDWRENLVVVGFAQQSMSIGEIPFPGVTICPITKTDRSKFNYSEIFHLIKQRLDGQMSDNVIDEKKYINEHN